jgi:limonene-1,2-epoxide hydrolase
MSTSPVETVRAFLKCWAKGPEAIYQSLYDYLSPDCVWENIGLSRTVGPKAAHECYAAFPPMANCLRIDVDILAMAAQGDTVLNERHEHVIDKDGRESWSVRTMGAFVVKDGRITQWRDYFDSQMFAGYSGTGAT